jgi:hypothetical protein
MEMMLLMVLFFSAPSRRESTQSYCYNRAGVLRGPGLFLAHGLVQCPINIRLSWPVRTGAYPEVGKLKHGA